MGKGDRKTRRGKLFKGSYGVRRKTKKRKISRSRAKLQEKISETRTDSPVTKPLKTTTTSKKTTGLKKQEAESKPEQAEE